MEGVRLDITASYHAVANTSQVHVQPVMAASCAWLQANAPGTCAPCLPSNQCHRGKKWKVPNVEQKVLKVASGFDVLMHLAK
jgi:hypothetical protein